MNRILLGTYKVALGKVINSCDTTSKDKIYEYIIKENYIN